MSLLTGKLVSQTEIKSSGDVFHELFRHKPHQLSTASPAKIQKCDLHEGDWGAQGSILVFNYTLGGKKRVAKERIEAIDEEKKLVSFKMIEGDLLKHYKSLCSTVHVENLQGERNLVTWTLEYEKLNDNIPADPNTLMDFLHVLTKDIEAHHLSDESLGSTKVKNLVGSIEIKSDGDVFHEIFRERPHHIPTMSPACIQGVDLHDGDWGKVGSVIFWNYTHDGKEKVVKDVVEAIDEAKKSVRFRVIEGDLMEQYKTFVATVHVDTVGENNLVTWTFEYEKQNESIPDPYSLMEFCLTVTKDIETHHLK